MNNQIRNIVFILVALLLAAACAEIDPDQPVPDTPKEETYEAVTGSASNVDAGSAVLSGSITTTAKDLAGITAGMVYSTSSSLSGAKELKAASFGAGHSFSVKATDLSAATTYYFAAFVVNKGSYSYGEKKSFVTSSIPITAVTLDRETLTLRLSDSPVRLTAPGAAPTLQWRRSQGGWSHLWARAEPLSPSPWARFPPTVKSPSMTSMPSIWALA